MATKYFLDNTRDSQAQILNQEGKIYSVTTGLQTVNASGYMALKLTNPANSNNMIDIIRVEGGSTGTMTLDVLRNAALSVSGLTLSPCNRNWDYSDNSSMIVEYISQASDPVSGGDILTSFTILGGSLDIKYDGEFIIPDDSTDKRFIIRINNDTSETNKISIGVTWIEV